MSKELLREAQKQHRANLIGAVRDATEHLQAVKRHCVRHDPVLGTQAKHDEAMTRLSKAAEALERFDTENPDIAKGAK